MRATWRAASVGVVGLVLASPAFSVGAQEPASPAQATPAPAAPVAAFNGTWDYNDKESVNAATGRPEQGTPGQRRPTLPTAPGSLGGAPSGSGGGNSGVRVGPGGYPPGGYGGSGYPGGYGGAPMPPAFGGGFTRLAADEARTLMRDLLEVPETLTISVTPESVTFVDDLERALTFATDGKEQKFRLSASSFEARTTWEPGGQLHKNVQGARGFKMREIYYLSEDGRRLFVILRIGEQKPEAPVVGVNRVYDRIDSEEGLR